MNSDPIVPDNSHRKRRINTYQSRDLYALVFETSEDIKVAIEAFFDDPELVVIPWDLIASQVIVIPKEYLKSVTARNLSFRAEELIDPEKLTPEELAQVRRERFYPGK